MRDFYFKSTRFCALYLRPILLKVPFVFYKENGDVMNSINLIKNHYSRKKGPAKFKIPQEIVDTIPSKILP
jgi:hypothetical protein